MIKKIVATFFKCFNFFSQDRNKQKKVTKNQRKKQRKKSKRKKKERKIYKKREKTTKTLEMKIQRIKERK